MATSYRESQIVEFWSEVTLLKKVIFKPVLGKIIERASLNGLYNSLWLKDNCLISNEFDIWWHHGRENLGVVSFWSPTPRTAYVDIVSKMCVRKVTSMIWSNMIDKQHNQKQNAPMTIWTRILVLIHVLSNLQDWKKKLQYYKIMLLSRASTIT